MPTALDHKLYAAMRQAVAEHVFPGCQVGYVRDGETTVLVEGRLTYEADSPVVTAATMYDVASITKSVPTSSVILKLVEDGKLSLDDKVINYIPEISNEFREQLLVRHLLTFTAMFNLSDSMANVARESPGQLMEAIFKAPLAGAPGQEYVYTNAPSLLLGLIAERICGKKFDVIAQEMFFEPLGMSSTTFHTDGIPADRLAPTAVDWRDEVRGKVHDPGAWTLYEAGKVPGHAGLFSTAVDLLKFAEMLLDGGEYDGRRYFDEKTVTAMHTNQLEAIGATAGLGWSVDNPQAFGTAKSASAFGKTGFTGTMILVDPAKKAGLVVLSNRTYPETPKSYEPMRAFWRKIADLILSA